MKFNGVKKIVGYAPIADTQWIVAYRLEQSEALKSISTLGRILSMFVLAAGAIGIIITYIISARISEPLMNICKKIEDYSNNIYIYLPAKIEMMKLEFCLKELLLC